jgi:hypothetical protein
MPGSFTYSSAADGAGAGLLRFRGTRCGAAGGSPSRRSRRSRVTAQRVTGREPRPGRSGCRRGHRSPSRSQGLEGSPPALWC